MKHKFRHIFLPGVIMAAMALTAPADAQTAKKGKDTSLLKESYRQEDIPANEYLQKQLEPIRANFKKINSNTRWTTIREETLTEAGEGGVAAWYYQGRQLRKIVTRTYGETFQQLNEYYLLNGQLSFVLERQYRYNRPIYYDSTAMRANNDSVAFDFDSSAIEENRGYFEKGRLIHLVNNQDCGAPFASEFLQEEEKRIKADFKRLRQLR